MALASMLVDEEACHQCVNNLEPYHFNGQNNKEIFKAISKVSKETKVDTITVLDYLEKNNSEITIDNLLNITEQVSTTANIQNHITKLRELGNKRMAVKMLNQSADEILNNQLTATEAITRLENVKPKLVDCINEEKDLFSEVNNAIDYLQEIVSIKKGEYKGNQPPVISTGIQSLDSITTGIWSGEYHVIAARPSIGKTAFALQLLQNIKAKSLFFSLEMSTTKLILRLMQSLGNVNLKRLIDGRATQADWSGLKYGAERLKGLNMEIDDTQGITCEYIQAKTYQAVKERGVQCVFIDYISLIKYNGNQSVREQQVSEISTNLKRMAVKLNIPVIVLCQLNRLAEGNSPQLHHLRESGSMEQDADMVIMLDRQRDENEMKLIVAKNRNGETGTAKTIFNQEKQSITSDSGIRDEDIPNYIK